MHPNKFAELSKEIDRKGNEILIQANKEYASDEDKLENFKKVAELLKAYRPHLKDVPLDVLAEDVAWVYRLKHVIAQMKDTSIREDMLGRTIDDINYAKLLAGLRRERLAEDHAYIKPFDRDDAAR